MKHIKSKWLTIAFYTLLAALLMHSGTLLRYVYSSSEKVPVLISGPRTEIADNYFYFTLLRHAPERFVAPPTDSLDTDGGDYRHINSVSSSYAPALYAGYFLYRISAFVTPNPREALLLTAVLHTWILAACIVIFLLTLLNSQRGYTPSLIFLLAAFSMIGIDAFSISTYYGFPYWDKSLLTNEPNPVRLINPTMFWAAGLLATTYVVRWFRTDRNTDLLLGTAITFLCCLFSISVGAALLGALGLTVLVKSFKLRCISWKLMVIFLAGLIGLVWTYLQLVAYASTPLGQDLKHGEFDHLAVKWQFLLFLILIPILKRWLKEESAFIISLLIASVAIGSICDSFNLGSRLWMRGGAIFVWTITLFLLLRIAYSVEVHINGAIKYFAKSVLAVALMALVIHSQYRDPNSWVGFILKEKAELYTWIDKNIEPDSIMASEDIEDAFLIPIYTNSKSLFSSIGMTNRTLDEEMRRFFFAMKLYGSDLDIAKEIIEVKKNDLTDYYNHIFSNASPGRYTGQKADAVIFLRNVIYIPYVKRFSKILDEQEQHDAFASMLNRRVLEGRNAFFKFEYAILNSEKPRPKHFMGWKAIYSNNKYELLVNPIYNKTSLD